MAQVEETRKQTNWLLTGCGFGLLLVAVVTGVGFFFLTKTGLVGPASAFEMPMPTRVVEATMTTDEIQQTLVSSALRSLKQGEITVVITESMMTALLRDGLEQTRESTFDVARAQIVIVDHGSAELYIPLRINDRSTTLRANVGLALEGERVRVAVDGVRLGYMWLPGRWAAEASETALQKVLDTQLNQAQGAIKLTGLQLQDGELRLSGTVSLNPLQLLR